MNSLRPILSTTKGSTFPHRILPPATLRPRLIRRPPLAHPPTFASTISRTSASSDAASPPRASSALGAGAGDSASDISLLWEERVEKGCAHVMDSFTEYFSRGGRVILKLVEALDIYLIGTVMIVFGMGLYELFISNLDVAKSSSQGSSLIGLFKLPERPKWLEIKSVSELKTKIGHVIVLVLLIGLLDKSKKVAISSSIDLLCFSASILLSSGCLYLLSMLQN